MADPKPSIIRVTYPTFTGPYDSIVRMTALPNHPTNGRNMPFYAQILSNEFPYFALSITHESDSLRARIIRQLFFSEGATPSVYNGAIKAVAKAEDVQRKMREAQASLSAIEKGRQTDDFVDIVTPQRLADFIVSDTNGLQPQYLAICLEAAQLITGHIAEERGNTLLRSDSDMAKAKDIIYQALAGDDKQGISGIFHAWLSGNQGSMETLAAQMGNTLKDAFPHNGTTPVLSENGQARDERVNPSYLLQSDAISTFRAFSDGKIQGADPIIDRLMNLLHNEAPERMFQASQQFLLAQKAEYQDAEAQRLVAQDILAAFPRLDDGQAPHYHPKGTRYSLLVDHIGAWNRHLKAHADAARDPSENGIVAQTISSLRIAAGCSDPNEDLIRGVIGTKLKALGSPMTLGVRARLIANGTAARMETPGRTNPEDAWDQLTPQPLKAWTIHAAGLKEPIQK